jgi:serine/threonine protein kinase
VSRRKDPVPPDALLTSQDIFGDLVDGPIPEEDEEKPPAPPPPPAPSAAPSRTPAPPTDPSAGRPYGPYTLVKRIAVGGMAEVFKATQSGALGFKKVLAVKRLLPHLARNQELVDLFINEAKVVAPLSHPNIVPIFDLGRIENSYYIAMEYVHGRDLRSIERRAAERGPRIPHALSVLVAMRICSALGYAHRKKDARGEAMGIVHRDVSPQNILIAFEGSVKLTDFGIARAASKSTVTDRQQLRGKLSYMSPEQARGETTDHRSDIFCLGIVLYEMLTGQRPFQSDSEASILEKVRAGHVPPPREVDPSVPERLERVVLKALHPDPDERYQDAGGLLRALERGQELVGERDMAGYLEELFDPRERGVLPEEPAAAVEEFDIEFESARPAPDAMSVEKLLTRFRRGR